MFSAIPLVSLLLLSTVIHHQVQVAVSLLQLHQKSLLATGSGFHHHQGRYISTTSQLYASVQQEQSRFFDNLYVWLQSESLNTLIAKDEVLSIVRELRANEPEESVYRDFGELWEYLTERITREPRSLNEILGDANAAQLLDYIEEADPIDPDSVKVFLQNPVFESMLGNILYDTIFEFLRRVDLIGNIVNRLPIIGPIRVAIVSEFKSSLDRTLGDQIKQFLAAGASSKAVQRMVQFLLSDSNKGAINSAGRKVAEALLLRTPAEVLSLNDDVKKEKLKVVLWSFLKSSDAEALTPVLDFVYDKVGDKKFFSSLKVRPPSEAAESSPTSQHVMARIIQRFLSSEQGQSAYESLASIKQDVDEAKER